jgi:CheY-like chemotaxis protein
MKRTILIAEDEALVVLDLTAQLQTLGYTIVGSAVSGEETIKLALDLCPDIILIDIRLKGRISGLQAAIEILKQKVVSIIFVTASSDKNTLKQLKDFPATVLKKPFTSEQLKYLLEVVDQQK